MTRFLEFIQPDLGRLSLGGILADIRTSMMDEVDFTKVSSTCADLLDGLCTCVHVRHVYVLASVLRHCRCDMASSGLGHARTNNCVHSILVLSCIVRCCLLNALLCPSGGIPLANLQ